MEGSQLRGYEIYCHICTPAVFSLKLLPAKGGAQWLHSLRHGAPLTADSILRRHLSFDSLTESFLVCTMAQWLKNLLAMQETQRCEFDSWDRKIPWRRKWQPSILAWRIPWTEEPDGL